MAIITAALFIHGLSKQELEYSLPKNTPIFIYLYFVITAILKVLKLFDAKNRFYKNSEEIKGKITRYTKKESGGESSSTSYIHTISFDYGNKKINFQSHIGSNKPNEIGAIREIVLSKQYPHYVREKSSFEPEYADCILIVFLLLLNSIFVFVY